MSDTCLVWKKKRRQRRWHRCAQVRQTNDWKKKRITNHQAQNKMKMKICVWPVPKWHRWFNWENGKLLRLIFVFVLFRSACDQDKNKHLSIASISTERVDHFVCLGCLLLWICFIEWCSHFSGAIKLANKYDIYNYVEMGKKRCQTWVEWESKTLGNTQRSCCCLFVSLWVCQIQCIYIFWMCHPFCFVKPSIILICSFLLRFVRVIHFHIEFPCYLFSNTHFSHCKIY